MVLLHALPFDGRMWSDADREVSERPLVPDLFRLGTAVTDWAGEVVAMAGSEELIVVGSSVGGSCALEMAHYAPEQVAAIVLIGAKASVRPDPGNRDQAIRVLETQGMEIAWNTYWAPIFGTSTPAAVLSTARDIALSQDVAEVVNGVRAFHNRRDLTEFAAAWRKPFVAISGDQDQTPPLSASRPLGQGPRRRFEVIEDCGHYVNLEQPKRFQSLLSDIVSAIPGYL